MKIIIVIIELIGISTIAIAMSSLSAYISGEGKPYTWIENDVGMALSTSIVLLIDGIAIYLTGLNFKMMMREKNAG